MVIIETTTFTRLIQTLLSDDEYGNLQHELIQRPDAGVVIPGSGGVRKIRWIGKGHGKRGGTRVIYYWAVSKEQILMLLIYPKNIKDDLTPEQIKAMKQIVKEEYK